jgi:hypothetical protein
MAVLIASSSKRDLLCGLRRLDISVPGRECVRSHEQKERWVICRLLSSLAHADWLTYPLTTKHAAPPDPDFFLSTSGTHIGVEVTEATSVHWSAFLDYLANASVKTRLIEPASFRPGAWKRERKQAQRLEMMETEANKGKLTAPAWYGSEAEEDWAHYIVEAVHEKLQKAYRYRANCQKLWLAIYENAPLPHVDYSQALDLVRSKLTNAWCSESGFDALFIDSGNKIVCVERDAHKIIPVQNLWRDAG